MSEYSKGDAESSIASINPLAQQFGALAEIYEKGRPELPEQLIDILVEQISINPHFRVLELGAGTGKLTRLLMKLGVEVIATEPLEGMRQILARILPSVDIRPGSAEQIPVESGTTDLVIAADAFHWFARVATREELLRILTPTGVVVAISTQRDLNSRWQIELTRLLLPAYLAHAGLDMSPQGEWQKILAPPEFGEIQTQQLAFGDSYTADRLTSFVSSLHYVAALEPNEHRDLLRQVITLLDSHPETTGQSQLRMDFILNISSSTRTQLPYRTK